jgi:predicted CXXCH cytochrome family protein
VRRITLLFIGGALWLFLAAIPVFADGGPHVLTVNNGSAGITADSCAGCHRAHTSTSPTGMLLTDSSPTITGYCRSCHGATGTGAATDVDTGVQYSLDGDGLRTGPEIGALRSGGFIKARIGSSAGSRDLAAPGAETKNAFIPVVAPTPVTSAHLALPGTGLTATNILWGNGGINSSVYGPTLAAPMECTSCHNPHGNGNYRILDTLPVPGVAATGSPAVVVASLVGTRVAGPPSSYSAWTAVTGMAVKDSPYVVGRQKNYTVIAKAPAGTENYPAYPIPNPTPGAYLLYTDQLGAYTGNAGIGDYLKKFLTYNVDEEATPGTAISNFYDGPNGSPNQGGFSSTGSRLTDFPENVPGSASAGKNYEGFGYQMTLWCTQCHTRYLGWSSSRSTPSGDATYMFRHSTSKYRVCSTCHVSHGSNAIMNVNPLVGGVASANLPFPDGVVHNKSLTSGDSRLLKLDNRGICLVCHDPTGVATGFQGAPGQTSVGTAP